MAKPPIRVQLVILTGLMSDLSSTNTRRSKAETERMKISMKDTLIGGEKMAEVHLRDDGIIHVQGKSMHS
jgi:hypothetical protein